MKANLLIERSLEILLVLITFFWSMSAFEKEQVQSVYVNSQYSQFMVRQPASLLPPYRLGVNTELQNKNILAPPPEIQKNTVFGVDSGRNSPAWKLWNNTTHPYFWIP